MPKIAYLNSANQNLQSSPDLYTTLDTTMTEIRVLYIDPTDRQESEIQAHLSTISLGDTPCVHYTALSYVWGDQSVTVDIKIDDHTVKVTTNLADALRSLRRCSHQVPQSTSPAGRAVGRPGPFWIDALCINQSNSSERSHQVHMMGTIYASANVVISWLGELMPKYVAGVDALAKIHAAFAGAQGSGDFDWIDWLSQDHQTALWQWDTKTRQANKTWTSIAKILNHPYWRRIWIIQEVAMSKSAIIKFGDTTLPFNTLDSFHELCKAVNKCMLADMSSLLHMYAQIKRLGVRVSLLPRLLATRQRMQEGGTYSLPHILTHSYDSIATDPWDKIYGLLGMTTSCIRANYSSSLLSVYRELAITLNETDGVIVTSPLDFLLYAGIKHTKSLDSWPSRVPHWSADQHKISGVPNKIFMEAPFGPVSDYIQLFDRQPFRARENSLYVKGTLDDSVVATNSLSVGKTFGDAKCDLLRLMKEHLELHGEDSLLPLLKCLLWTDYHDNTQSVWNAFVDIYGEISSTAQTRGIEVPAALSKAVQRGVAGKGAFIDFTFFWGHQMWQRCVCYTSRGYFVATAASDTQIGDNVSLVPGCSWAVLLRPVE